MIIPRAFCSLTIIFPAWRRLLLPTLAMLALLSVSGHRAPAQAPSNALRLAKIEVNGLVRYTPEQVLTVSGLQIGQLIDIPAADEAATRLMDSGLFKKLSYRFRTNANQATVIFEVEETKASARVVFDNFVWFTEDELNAAIRRDVPTFDGTAPEAGDLTDKITKSLQKLLADRKLPGQVEYFFSADIAGNNPRHIYSVKGVKIPICALHFPGAVDVKESELLNAAKPLLNQDYSGPDVLSFIRVNLLPLYRQRAHLRAGFLDPAVKVPSDADCQNGVDVTIQVDEGSIYTWEKAEWTGNTAFSAQDLSAALEIKPGDRADGLKIDKSPRLISELYGRRGYLTPRISFTPMLDDANRRVTYLFKVTEGPQYRMGELVLKNFSEAEEIRFREKWKLVQGEILDASYPRTFLDQNVRDILSPGPTRRSIGIEVQPDQQKRTANVVFTIKETIAGS